jgi:DME family drug/metabolite transporter
LFVYLVAAAIAWGTGGAVASLLYQESGLGPIAVSWWRFVIGAALLAAFVRTRARTRTGKTRHKGRILLLGLGMAISQTAYFAAVGRSGVALATVITLGVSPLLVAIGERLLLAESISRWQGAVLGLAIGGLCLLVLTNDGAAKASTIGVALALLSGATYAGVILVQRASGSSGDDDGTVAAFVIGAVCLLPLALIEGILPVRGAAPTVAMLLYLGAIPTALAYGLFFAALGRVKATTASVVALLEPVTAAAIGVTLLHERLTVAAITGALVLLLAVACYPVAGHRVR